jgi:hypothetical protein
MTLDSKTMEGLSQIVNIQVEPNGIPDQLCSMMKKYLILDTQIPDKKIHLSSHTHYSMTDIIDIIHYLCCESDACYWNEH